MHGDAHETATLAVQAPGVFTVRHPDLPILVEQHIVYSARLRHAVERDRLPAPALEAVHAVFRAGPDAAIDIDRRGQDLAERLPRVGQVFQAAVRMQHRHAKAGVGDRQPAVAPLPAHRCGLGAACRAEAAPRA
jgi:hypothetical protein